MDVGATRKGAVLALREWIVLFEHFNRLPATLKDQVWGAEARLRRQQRRLHKVHRTRVPRDACTGAGSAAAPHQGGRQRAA